MHENKQQDNWFVEKYLPRGSAFSLKTVKKLHEEQSAYQWIEIYQTEQFGHLMVIDGCIMLTQLDNFLYHEMMSHTALLTHPNPQHVVIIGGGDCGTLREVLKHSGVNSAIQIDIDERVTRLSEQYFPELCSSNDDPRATLLFHDGIAWMKQAQPQSIDIIIIDSTDPVGPAEGLFSKDFYRDCFHALKPNGLLIQQTESPLYHELLIRDVHQALKESGFEQTQLINFPQPCYPSGWWSAIMASPSLNLKHFRANDAQMKKFSTHYYNAEIHQAALALPEFLKKNEG